MSPGAQSTEPQQQKHRSASHGELAGEGGLRNHSLCSLHIERGSSCSDFCLKALLNSLAFVCGVRLIVEVFTHSFFFFFVMLLTERQNLFLLPFFFQSGPCRIAVPGLELAV